MDQFHAWISASFNLQIITLRILWLSCFEHIFKEVSLVVSSGVSSLVLHYSLIASKKVSALKYDDFILHCFTRRLSQIGGSKTGQYSDMYRLDTIKMRIKLNKIVLRYCHVSFSWFTSVLTASNQKLFGSVWLVFSW